MLQHVMFCVWLLSLGMFPGFSHVAACIIPFYGWIIFHCMKVPHFAHFLNPRNSWWTWGCSYFLAIISNAALNICVPDLGWMYVFVSLGYILRSEITGPRDNSVFNFSGNCRLFNKAAVLFWKIPVSPHPCQRFSVLLITVILVCVWNGISLWFLTCFPND